MRFALYVALLLAVLPLVLSRPFFGLCVYYVVSLLQPKIFCWHPDFQDAMLVGVPLVIGAMTIGVRRLQVVPRREVLSGRVIGWRERFTKNMLFEPAWPLLALLLLLIYITINRAVAPYPMGHTAFQYRALWKIFIVTALLTGMASDHRRVRILYIVVAMATAFWAIKGGLKVVLLGPHQVYGKSYDNNLFALTSAMVLPMIFYYGMSIKSHRWRNVLLVCAVLVCLAIICSRSRAGFLALAVVLTGMAWHSRYRLRAVAAVVLVLVVAFTTSGGEILERFNSIVNYNEDKSARSRLWTWQLSGKLLMQSPLVGVGFNNFELANRMTEGSRKAAHNIYLQNLAELGLLGHPLWLIVVIGSYFSMFRFMRRARKLPPDMRWSYNLARGLWLGMTAYCIHGIFHNEEYLELMFTLIGLHVALKVATRRQLESRRIIAESPPLDGSSAPSSTTTPKPPKKRLQPMHPGRMFPAWPRPGMA